MVAGVLGESVKDLVCEDIGEDIVTIHHLNMGDLIVMDLTQKTHLAGELFPVQQTLLIGWVNHMTSLIN